MAKVRGELAELAVSGAEIAVRVAPGASRNEVRCIEGAIRVLVTQIPEGGRATAEVQKLLARSLGVAKTRLA